MLSKTPNQQLAFLPDANVEALAACLVGMANADGGMIILGVAADGRPTVEIWDEEAEGALHAALSQIRPPVLSQWQPIEMKNGTTLIGLRVHKSPDLHTLSDGRVLVRHGLQNRPVGGTELTRLANSRSVAEYEMETVAAAKRSDFSEKLLANYLERREARGASLVGSLDSLLFEIGATDQTGQPTVFGLLMFCEHPQAFLPQSRLDFIRFPGTEPRRSNDGAVYGRRDEITGPLPRIIERAWNIIYEEMRVGAQLDGSLERKEILEYPRFAVREAVVNAVCHRDYRVKGSRIEIRMYSDRLEIISPGGLAGYMTLDNLVEDHFSRNPRIVNGLYYYGYIEELGLGIDLMIEEMTQAGHEPPGFDAKPHRFTVTLFNSRKKAPMPQWTHNINERQARAVTYVKQKGSITNREYQRLITGVSAETLRRDLANLVKQGILLKIGSKKGTYYILK